ncbi:membrane protein insertion efficiency factor YidD [Kocuria sp. KH4]
MSEHAHGHEDLLAAAPHEYVRPASAWQALWFLPQNALIAGLKLYRSIVSPLYGDVCRYFPSCSAYALESVTVHGAVRGLGLSVRRLLRCHPWAAGGIDRVPDGGRSFPDLASLPKIVLLNHPTLAERHQHHPAGGTGPAAQGELSP